MPENARAILYRRVSTNDQSLGLAAQLEALEAMAEARGWTGECVTDKGVSGSVPAEDRPELGPALETLGPGDVMAVAKLDRLSRSVLDFARILKRAEDGKWSIVVLDLGVDMTKPNGKLIANVLIAMAEWERETIRTRIREGLAQSNKRLGRRPGLPAVKKTKPKPISPTVRAAVEDLRAAGMSPAKIADRLNAHGHPSPAVSVGIVRASAVCWCDSTSRRPSGTARGNAPRPFTPAATLTRKRAALLWP